MKPKPIPGGVPMGLRGPTSLPRRAGAPAAGGTGKSRADKPSKHSRIGVPKPGSMSIVGRNVPKGY